MEEEEEGGGAPLPEEEEEEEGVAEVRGGQQEAGWGARAGGDVEVPVPLVAADCRPKGASCRSQGAPVVE